MIIRSYLAIKILVETFNIRRDMQKFFLKSVAIMFVIAFFSSTGYASTTQDQITFQALFNTWTQAFNKKAFPEVCRLFSKNITADYQGAPKKNYSNLCAGFQKIFQEKDRVYHNRFKIHQIYRSNNLAAIRITWYLDVYKKDTLISSIQEEGLDVLQKQVDGEWKIVNFIAYPTILN